MINPNGSPSVAAEAKKLFLEKYPQLEADDPIAEMASWNALLEKKVDDFGNQLETWTSAILKQTNLAAQQNQLIVSQNLTLQETGKNNAALGKALLQLKPDLLQLQQEFKPLKHTIETHRAALETLKSSTGSASQALSNQLKTLERKLASLEEKINLLSQIQEIEVLNGKLDSLTKAWSAEGWLTWTAIALLLLLPIIQVVLLAIGQNQVQSQIDSIDKKVNSALIRLKRIEEK